MRCCLVGTCSVNTGERAGTHVDSTLTQHATLRIGTRSIFALDVLPRTLATTLLRPPALSQQQLQSLAIVLLYELCLVYTSKTSPVKAPQ